MKAVIATDPLLSEVRANEVTRIKAEPAALCELPFGLQVPGDGCDYDESLWSEAMKHEHLEYVAGTDTRGVHRVLYVNDARWGAFTTAEGERLLPDDGDVAAGDLIAGSYLVAGKQIDEDQSMCSYDTSEWHLSLDLEPAVIDGVLDLLARRSPEFSDVVTAARDPKSRPGRARRRALKKLGQDHS